MKPLVDLAYDSIRAGAPGLSDATCKVIAASIVRKAIAALQPVPAPDSGRLSPASGWPSREDVARIVCPEAFTPWEGYPIGQKDAFGKADAIMALFPLPPANSKEPG